MHAIDIEPQIVSGCQAMANEAGLNNIDCAERDFVTSGTCLPDNAADFVMLFNILHAEDPVSLFEVSYRILVPGGKIGVIHWNYDSTTPRGPSMDIRPGPEQCQNWIQAAGFQLTRPFIDLPPYHDGMVEKKQKCMKNWQLWRKN